MELRILIMSPIFFSNLNKNLHCVLQSDLIISPGVYQGSLSCNVVHVWEGEEIVYETWKKLPCVMEQVGSTVESNGEAQKAEPFKYTDGDKYSFILWPNQGQLLLEVNFELIYNLDHWQVFGKEIWS